MQFKTLSPREFDRYKGTCPLEIGRFEVVNNKVQEIIGPLPIYNIWTSMENGDSMSVSPLNEDGTLVHEVLLEEGSDGKLYTQEQDGVRYSITKVLDAQGI